jgi:hypothetical protein
LEPQLLPTILERLTTRTCLLAHPDSFFNDGAFSLGMEIRSADRTRVPDDVRLWRDGRCCTRDHQHDRVHRTATSHGDGTPPLPPKSRACTHSNKGNYSSPAQPYWQPAVAYEQSAQTTSSSSSATTAQKSAAFVHFCPGKMLGNLPKTVMTRAARMPPQTTSISQQTTQPLARDPASAHATARTRKPKSASPGTSQVSTASKCPSAKTKRTKKKTR